MNGHDARSLIQDFFARFDATSSDALWLDHMGKFRRFWTARILAEAYDPILDGECDEIIKILDRNGKGNTKTSEAVAKAMVPQGAWRRMFNEFHQNRELGRLVYSVLTTVQPEERAACIDELYRKNEKQRNHLTGPSGNTVGALLAAFDPVNNLSIISLRDRQAVIEYFGFAPEFDFGNSSTGTKIVGTNEIILNGFRALGLTGTARTVTKFVYSPEIRPLWKDGHTILRDDGSVSVTVPLVQDDEEAGAPQNDELVRLSMQIQGLIARIGTIMGFQIWLPRADRSRVLRVWNPEPGQLIDVLPLGYDSTTTKTIEQIDVLWLKRRSIVRAFEVEHTTSVYSGLLRMADLVALQPNINVKLHIVAPAEKREKVLQEIMRPVFSLLEGRALADMCTYLSYDQIKEIAELKHLDRLSHAVIDDYEEMAE